jgi:hypothetical protein
MKTEDDMTNATAVGWRTVTVKEVKNFSIQKPTGKKNFLKFIVDVTEGGRNNAYQASQLVEPTLIPGKPLYQWLRVCKIPLSAVDDKLNPTLFINQQLQAKLVANGDFYNIVDIRSIPVK